MSKKNKDGVFSLLRQILAEQKKQTKILQAIESGQEHETILNNKFYSKLVIKKNDGKKIAEVTLTEATPATGYQIILTPKYD